IPTSVNRAQLVCEAEQFIGAPYLWGGRAATLKGLIASVDCSSLINLLYRAQGVEIPRDAHDQYLKMNPTQFPLPGDPLYMTKKERMSHVILYLGNNRFLESPETGKKVRILTWGKDLWEKEGRLHFKDREGIYLHQYRTIPIPPQDFRCIEESHHL
ncbi:MAG: C40 family peptidase, partial [Chlamydiales bacterium]